MEEHFTIPGFQLPDAPKEKSRAFGKTHEPFELVFLENQPLDQPARSFEFFISLNAGEKFIDLMCYSKTNRFVIVRPGAVGKDYLIRLMPDELELLPNFFTVSILENKSEIFRRIVNMLNRPVVPCPQPADADTTDPVIVDNWRVAERGY